MPTYRAYLNEKQGNGHSRVVDAEALTEEDFRRILDKEISDDEVIDQVQTLYTETAANFEAIVYRVADELQKRSKMSREDAVAVATQVVLHEPE